MTTTTPKRIPTSTRLLIALIADRCLDVNIGGTHWAYFDMRLGEIPAHDYLNLQIYTMPVGGKHTDPETVSLEADIADLWNDTSETLEGETAKDRVEKQLNEILAHLDGLDILAMYERDAAGVVS